MCEQVTASHVTEPVCEACSPILITHLQTAKGGRGKSREKHLRVAAAGLGQRESSFGILECPGEIAPCEPDQRPELPAWRLHEERGGRGFRDPPIEAEQRFAPVAHEISVDGELAIEPADVVLLPHSGGGLEPALVELARPPEIS